VTPQGPGGPLTGRAAFVTGGSRGIGRAIATAMSEAGADVMIASRTAEGFEHAGRHIHAVTVDVTDEQQCRDAVRHCQDRLGGLDILVNNAGIAESAKFLDTDTDLWHRHMRTDVDAPFWTTHAALPLMLERDRGAVIFIGSVASKVGLPYVSAYVAAKHALLGLCRSLAAEFAATGLTFNCVSPFYVATQMVEETIRNIMDKTGRDRDSALQPLLSPQGRLILPEEVAAMCVLLASDLGRSITGQSIGIDGGRLQT
jgi:NAD(P)-dependent dehydrogenase (short-subunit alcohol dehydrogenase family)